MRHKKGKTPVYEYLRKIEKHFNYLVESGKINEPTRKAFFNQFLGCSEATYNNWWRFGIRKIYLSILLLLDEIKEHKQRIRILEEQLNELTKK